MENFNEKPKGPPTLPDHLRAEYESDEPSFEAARYPIGENRFFALYRNKQEAELGKLKIVIEDAGRNIVFDFSEYSDLQESWFGGHGRVTDSRDNSESIEIDSKELASDPREMLCVAHEIGHILVDQSLGGQTSEAVLRRKTVRSLADRRGRRGKSLDVRALQVVLDEERDAWAQAIRLTRRLKHEYGADLFTPFKSGDEFFAWIRLRALRVYEQSVERAGELAKTGDDRIERWKEKDPEAYEALLRSNKTVQHVEKDDEIMKQAREKEVGEFKTYVKETYPDLYEEAEDISNTL